MTGFLASAPDTTLPRHDRRRHTAWLGALAVLLYAIAPYGVSGQATAQTFVELCTAYGIVTVALPDTDGDAPTSSKTDCPACTITSHGGMAGKAALPPAFIVPAATAQPADVANARSERRPASAGKTTQRTRAPPLPA